MDTQIPDWHGIYKCGVRDGRILTSIPTAHGKVVSEAIVDSCIHLEGGCHIMAIHFGVNSRRYKVPPSVTGEPEFASVLAEALK